MLGLGLQTVLHVHNDVQQYNCVVLPRKDIAAIQHANVVVDISVSDTVQLRQ